MRRVIVVACVALVSGCVSRVGDFSLIANQNFQAPTKTIQKSVVGENCRIAFTLGMFPTIEEAVDDAQRKAGQGNAIANASVEFEQQWLVLFYRYCFRVKGDIVQVGGAE